MRSESRTPPARRAALAAVASLVIALCIAAGLSLRLTGRTARPRHALLAAASASVSVLLGPRHARLFDRAVGLPVDGATAALGRAGTGARRVVRDTDGDDLRAGAGSAGDGRDVDGALGGVVLGARPGGDRRDLEEDWDTRDLNEDWDGRGVDDWDEWDERYVDDWEGFDYEDEDGQGFYDDGEVGFGDGGDYNDYVRHQDEEERYDYDYDGDEDDDDEDEYEVRYEFDEYGVNYDDEEDVIDYNNDEAEVADQFPDTGHASHVKSFVVTGLRDWELADGEEDWSVEGRHEDGSFGEDGYELDDSGEELFSADNDLFGEDDTLYLNAKQHARLHYSRGSSGWPTGKRPVIYGLEKYAQPDRLHSLADVQLYLGPRVDFS